MFTTARQSGIRVYCWPRLRGLFHCDAFKTSSLGPEKQDEQGEDESINNAAVLLHTNKKHEARCTPAGTLTDVVKVGFSASDKSANIRQ